MQKITNLNKQFQKKLVAIKPNAVFNIIGAAKKQKFLSALD
jgi:hypothetical protein